MKKGFTLLEILLVIAAIGILAAIVIIAINPTRQLNQVRDADRDSSSNALVKALDQYLIDNGYYPAGVDGSEQEVCGTGSLTESDALGGIDCTGLLDLRVLVPDYVAAIPEEPGTVGNGVGYRVSTDFSRQRVHVRPSAIDALSCPEGFVPVPGNLMYDTDDFCVMKYEAKVDTNGDGQGDTGQDSGWNTWPYSSHPVGSGGREIVSSASGYSLAQANLTEAQSACQTIGANLLTNAQYMTIARNLESVTSNWEGGVVGAGRLYQGHSDGAPNNALVASSDDSDGYASTGNIAGSSGADQRRTQFLSNGEVLWDFSGNIWELVSDTIIGIDKPTYDGFGGSGDFTLRSYDVVNDFSEAFPYDQVKPSNATWGNSLNVGIYGIGGYDAVEYAIIRGGNWFVDDNGGLFSFAPIIAVSSFPDDSSVGFRCAI